MCDSSMRALVWTGWRVDTQLCHHQLTPASLLHWKQTLSSLTLQLLVFLGVVAPTKGFCVSTQPSGTWSQAQVIYVLCVQLMAIASRLLSL